jgi:prepilin-type N-terminal cleavage/methylation domain-containing protein
MMAASLARHRLTDERGMTVAEILVALVIISIGLVGLASVVPISSYGIQEGNQMSTAAFLAEQRLEQVKTAAWTASPVVDCLGVSSNASFGGNYPPTTYTGTCHPTPGGTPSTSFPDESPAGSQGASPPTALANPYVQYTRQVRVQTCTVALCGVADTAIRLVTVQVTFTPLQGIGGVAVNAPQSIQVNMLMAQR